MSRSGHGRAAARSAGGRYRGLNRWRGVVGIALAGESVGVVKRAVGEAVGTLCSRSQPMAEARRTGAAASRTGGQRARSCSGPQHQAKVPWRVSVRHDKQFAGDACVA